MKGAGIWLRLGFVMAGLLITTSSLADLLAVSRVAIRRFDERTGALLSEAGTEGRTETLDTGCYGPDGNIYATGNSMGAGSILRFDGRTGKFLDFFVREGTFAAPMAIQFGPNGDLYVNATPMWFGPGPFGNTVCRFGPDGARKADLVKADQNLTFTEFVFGPDRNVYLLTQEGILKFNTDTGENMGLFIAATNNWVYGGRTFCFGRDGDLYWMNGDLRRFDGKTGALVGTILSGTEAGLDYPNQLTFGFDGDLYIGEGKTLEVKRFDGRTGQAKGIVATGLQNSYQSYILTGMGFSAPRLNIFPAPNGTKLSWPVTGGDFAVEARNSLDPTAAWHLVEGEPANSGGEFTLEVARTDEPTFFRLRQR